MLVSIEAIGGKKKAATKRKTPVKAKTIASHSYRSFLSNFPFLFISNIPMAFSLMCSISSQ
nr:MAG TPA: hypothetical protein [Caudoviricetes sp.]